jgi:mono/diheme cytochrome c family protein
MPDMAYSRAYEFYSTNPNFKNNLTAQKPVEGSIARGAMLPDHIGEFDTVAAKANKFSGSLTMTEIEEGGRLYNIQCGVCHGNNLDGNGPLYNGGNGKYPAAPANFKDAKYLNMPVGTMHHAIMYGKNLMGAYSSQLDAKQRWMVLAYIKKIQSENGGAALTSYFNIAEEAGEAPMASAAEAKDAEHKEGDHKDGEHKEGATMKTTETKTADAPKAEEKKAEAAAKTMEKTATKAPEKKEVKEEKKESKK